MRLQPERRQRLRVLTLKNAAWAVGGAIVLFVAFSAWNELRPPNPSRERLSDRGGYVARPAAAPEPAETVEEQPVSDETFAARQGAHALAPSPPPPAAAAPTATAAPPRRVTLKESRQRGERVVISGDANGVSVKATPARQ